VELLARTVRHLRLDADGAVAVEENLLDQSLLVDGRALFRRVFDQHLVEDGAGHLPGDSALVVISLEEIKRARLFALRVGELHAVFADERAGFQLLQQSHPLERPEGVGHQRLADMMAGKLFLLEEHDSAAFAGEDAGDSAARRPAAHYDHVIVV
jgi:hypothetical protein